MNESESEASDLQSLVRALTQLSEHQAGDGSGDSDRIAGLFCKLLPAPVCRRLGIYELPEDFLLSVVVPVFNEERTVREIVSRIQSCGTPCEIILVNDGSTDGTQKVIEELAAEPNVRAFTHGSNQGKGAAIRTGFQHVRGDVVIIQDADLEYDPRDYAHLLRPIVEGLADVVYGSRFSSTDRPVARYWHQTGNRMITLLSNMFTNLKLTDVETCFKMVKRDSIEQIVGSLREKGFGIEVEITAKLANIKGIRFYELPISYNPRSYQDGKKIKMIDGLRAIYCVLLYQILRH